MCVSFSKQPNYPIPSSKLHTNEKVRLEKSETKSIKPDICANTEGISKVFTKSDFFETFDPEFIQTAMEVLKTDTKAELDDENIEIEDVEDELFKT